MYSVGGERCRWKLREFHRTLTERGAIKAFKGTEDVRCLPQIDFKNRARRSSLIMDDFGMS